MELHKKQCKFCGTDIKYEKRENNFCNSSCAAKYNNPRKKKKQYFCQICKAEIKRQRKYCSYSCKLSKIREDALKDNKGSSIMARTYLVKKYGAKCMDCGWDKVNIYTNKVSIELEHIDGNHQNNSLENIKLLCPNCHSLTPTYKALNKGNGRHKRMLRYKSGKSF